MLCPKCKKAGHDVRMKCVVSEPQGAFERNRRYVCPECENEEYTVEKLIVYGWVSKVMERKN